MEIWVKFIALICLQEWNQRINIFLSDRNVLITNELKRKLVFIWLQTNSIWMSTHSAVRPQKKLWKAFRIFTAIVKNKQFVLHCKKNCPDWTQLKRQKNRFLNFVNRNMCVQKFARTLLIRRDGGAKKAPEPQPLKKWNVPNREWWFPFVRHDVE